MTLVSQIITDAYRESNIIPLVSTPNVRQVNEALPRLNSILASTLGNEVGQDFMELNVGGEFDISDELTNGVPPEGQLMLNLSEAQTIKLDPCPRNGQRFAVSDIAGNLATYNLTIDPNGRTIEDADTLVLSTNGLDRQWMYRSDTGNWVRYAALITTDEMPFPIDFDDYFILMLAMRLNPRYGLALSAESQRALQRSRSQIRARYNKPRPTRSDVGFLRFFTDRFFTYSDPTSFNVGYLWRR